MPTQQHITSKQQAQQAVAVAADQPDQQEGEAAVASGAGDDAAPQDAAMAEAEGMAQPADAAADAAATAAAAEAAGLQQEQQQQGEEEAEAQQAPPPQQGWWRRDGTIPAQGVELLVGSLPPGEPLNTLSKDIQQQLRWARAAGACRQKCFGASLAACLSVQLLSLLQSQL